MRRALPGTFVIEAVLEDLGVKAAVLRQAQEHFGIGCILASNTSSLSVTDIAAATSTPSRVVGMHFFNPVPVMRLVEVVAGLQTDPDVLDTVADLAVGWGKSVARVKSAPGFIVNRVARAFYGEPLRLLEEQAASPETLDEVLRAAGQFKMGPFELMDLIGNDVNAAVTRKVWTAFSFDSRFTPSRLQDELVAAGRYGRKSGLGFYDYSESAAQPEPAFVVAAETPDSVELHGSCAQLERLVDRSGVAVKHTSSARSRIVLPDGTTVLVTRGRTAREESVDLGSPVAVIDRCVDPAAAAGIAIAASEPSAAVATAGLLHAAGIVARPVDDVPGLVVARTLSLIANEAWETVLQGVASAQDIDVAMELGTNYPVGPFEWSRRWGHAAVLEIIDALWETYHDPRYRASRLLREAAAVS